MFCGIITLSLLSNTITDGYFSPNPWLNVHILLADVISRNFVLPSPPPPSDATPSKYIFAIPVELSPSTLIPVDLSK